MLKSLNNFRFTLVHFLEPCTKLVFFPRSNTRTSNHNLGHDNNYLRHVLMFFAKIIPVFFNQ
ncbi:hypothetical protein SAMN05216285_1603 [Natrinema salifodinae]|uniref:Uncharacterized protein n=1 Tax=Natrinema salifodinae TaxID=1202768 RepID=A0A1I0NDU2_9EURY|nr:hypothetical protein SAMN05216285_1603 [Natrinema salifodinae]